MPQFDLNAYERRADWKDMCLAVPCAQCLAEVGKMCFAARGPNPHLNAGQPRPDFHFARKYAAMVADAESVLDPELTHPIIAIPEDGQTFSPTVKGEHALTFNAPVKSEVTEDGS